MFNWNTPVEKTGLEKEIDEVLAQMHHCDSVDSDEYANMSVQLEKLYKLKEIDQKAMIHKNVSADTAVKTAGTLLGIILIVGHERAHVVTSKALTLIPKIL